jgi:hypothetical protein
MLTTESESSGDCGNAGSTNSGNGGGGGGGGGGGENDPGLLWFLNALWQRVEADAEREKACTWREQKWREQAGDGGGFQPVATLISLQPTPVHHPTAARGTAQGGGGRTVHKGGGSGGGTGGGGGSGGGGWMQVRLSKIKRRLFRMEVLWATVCGTLPSLLVASPP